MGVSFDVNCDYFGSTKAFYIGNEKVNSFVWNLTSVYSTEEQAMTILLHARNELLKHASKERFFPQSKISKTVTTL